MCSFLHTPSRHNLLLNQPNSHQSDSEMLNKNFKKGAPITTKTSFLASVTDDALWSSCSDLKMRQQRALCYKLKRNASSMLSSCFEQTDVHHCRPFWFCWKHLCCVIHLIYSCCTQINCNIHFFPKQGIKHFLIHPYLIWNFSMWKKKSYKNKIITEKKLGTKNSF